MQPTEVYIYDGTTLTNISEKEGLKSNFVGQIIESKEGYFWISTSKGLYKYNGETVINVTENLFNQNDIGIGCIFEDKKGTLWFNANKRDIYSYSNNVFTKTESKVGEFKPFTFTIYQDNQDRLWFVGLKGAYRIENSTFINVNRNGPW